jgi:hypothetical protein
VSASRLHPIIDCSVCRHWAFHCARDLEPAYVLGAWHHPSHAEDLLRKERCAGLSGAAVRLPSGALVPVGTGAVDCRTDDER